MVLRPRPLVDAQFLRRVFASPRVVGQIVASAVGSTMVNLNHSAVASVPVQFPPLPEQRAIARALSDVDDLISALDKLIEKKRAIKQATMQQLLTGRTRLPGFGGEWSKESLGSLATFLSGGTPPRANKGYWRGAIPWISATSLRSFKIWRSDASVTEEAVRIGSRMAPIGASLLLVRGSALHNEILCGIVTKPVCFNQDVKALVPAPRLLPGFLTWAIHGRSQDLLKLVSSAGNTAGVLDTKLLKSFKIDLPPLPGQRAIAAVLSDMDAEIAALERRRGKTRLVKRGMMQELLTGRIRLVVPTEVGAG